MVSRKVGGIIIGVILTVAIIAIIPVFVPITIARISTPLSFSQSGISTSGLKTSGFGFNGSLTATHETINAYQYLGYELNGNVEADQGTTNVASLRGGLKIEATIIHPNQETYTLNFAWNGSISTTGSIMSTGLIIGPNDMPIISGNYTVSLAIEWSFSYGSLVSLHGDFNLGPINVALTIE